MPTGQNSAVPSTFAERFEFSRDRQRVLGTWVEDQLLAEDVGVARSQISEYKARETAPPSERTLALAVAVGVDPGWLAFGEGTAAPAPEGFAAWLERRRSAATRPAPRVAKEAPTSAYIPKPRSSAKPAAKKSGKRA